MTFLAMDFFLKPSQIGFYLKMLLILFSCFGFDRSVVVFLNVGLFSLLLSFKRIILCYKCQSTWKICINYNNKGPTIP